MASRAPSVMAKFFPVEVYPVAAPVALVAVLFSAMFTRIVSADPEVNKGHERLVLDNPRDTAHGSSFRNHIRGFFADRIAAGDISIFANATN